MGQCQSSSNSKPTAGEPDIKKAHISGGTHKDTKGTHKAFKTSRTLQRLPIGMVASASSSTCEMDHQESELRNEEGRYPIENMTSWGVMDLQSLQTKLKENATGKTRKDIVEERRYPVENLTSWGVMDLQSLQVIIKKDAIENEGQRD